MTKRIYRVLSAENGARFARVEYNTYAIMDVSEQRYRYRGYHPPFDALPWKGEYRSTAACDTEPIPTDDPVALVEWGKRHIQDD